MTLVYNPTAACQNDGKPQRLTLGTLAGKSVGFIDNSKPNFNLLVDDLAELLVSRYGATTVIKRAKRGAAMPAPEAIVDELSEQCELVITGSGD